MINGQMITCVWCDEQTLAGAPCPACGGDPTGGVYTRPTGLAAVRERRLKARQAMLAARRVGPAGNEGADASGAGGAGVAGGAGPGGAGVGLAGNTGPAGNTEPAGAGFAGNTGLAGNTEPGTTPAGNTEPGGAGLAGNTPAAWGGADGVTAGPVTPGGMAPLPTWGPPQGPPVMPAQAAPGVMPGQAGPVGWAGAPPAEAAPPPGGWAPVMPAHAAPPPAGWAPAAPPQAGWAPDPAGAPAGGPAAAPLAAPVSLPNAWPLPPPAPPRRNVLPLVLAVVIPLVVVGLIAVALSTLGTGRPPSPAAVVAGGQSAASQAPASTVPGPSSGRPWVTYNGPNFTAKFPAVPASGADALDCNCGATIPIRAWRSVEGLTEYYVTELTVPSHVGATPDDFIDGMVSSVLHNSNVTFSASPRTQIGPYEVRDIKVTGDTFGASARVMVGAGTVWVLIGSASANQPPDWDYFLQSFAPQQHPLPAGQSSPDSPGFE